MPEFEWPNGAPAAISLAFDGLATDLVAEVRTMLRHADVKATFFVSPTEVLRDLAAWQAVAQDGHEIGNGCLHDATDGGSLPNWTLRTVEQELFMAHSFLEDFFPDQEARSFLYPGPATSCGQGSYRSIVEAAYPYAVVALQGVNEPTANLHSLLSCDASSIGAAGWSIVRIQSVADLRPGIEAAGWTAPVSVVAAYLESWRTP